MMKHFSARLTFDKFILYSFIWIWYIPICTHSFWIPLSILKGNEMRLVAGKDLSLLLSVCQLMYNCSLKDVVSCSSLFIFPSTLSSVRQVIHNDNIIRWITLSEFKLILQIRKWKLSKVKWLVQGCMDTKCPSVKA